MEGCPRIGRADDGFRSLRDVQAQAQSLERQPKHVAARQRNVTSYSSCSRTGSPRFLREGGHASQRCATEDPRLALAARALANLPPPSPILSSDAS